CETAGARTVPTCNGTSCGVACIGGAPKCNDNSCSQVLWSFANGLEGALASSTGLTLRVGMLNGNPALAMDVTNLTEVSFHFPICLSGTLDLSAKTLTAQVEFEGGTSTGEQFYVQASAPDPASQNFFGSRGVAANTKTTWTAAFPNTSL